MGLGELSVTVISARDLPDLQGCICLCWCGTQSPYFKLGFDGKRQWSSKVLKGGGTKPVWNDRNSFQLNSDKVTELVFEIWNKNICPDDVIATCKIPLFEVYDNGKDDRFMTLTDKKGSTAGEVHIIMEWHESKSARNSEHSAGAPPHPVPQQQMPPPQQLYAQAPAPAPAVTIVQAPPPQPMQPPMPQQMHAPPPMPVPMQPVQYGQPTAPHPYPAQSGPYPPVNAYPGGMPPAL